MSNIDEEAKNNFTIEMRIFENYEKVKYEIRNGRRLIGKNKILNIDDARDVFILWLFCVLCLGMPLTCVEILVCVQGFSRQCP